MFLPLLVLACSDDVDIGAVYLMYRYTAYLAYHTLLDVGLLRKTTFSFNSTCATCNTNSSLPGLNLHYMWRTCYWLFLLIVIDVTKYLIVPSQLSWSACQTYAECFPQSKRLLRLSHHILSWLKILRLPCRDLNVSKSVIYRYNHSYNYRYNYIVSNRYYL